MKKIKQQILLIILAVLVCVAKPSYAAECGLNIVNDSPEKLQGYTLKVQVAGEAELSFTQTIDVSNIPPHNSQYIPLPLDLANQFSGDVWSKNEACVSLFDPQGKRMTECLILDWKLINHFPILKVKIDAHKKLASVESPLEVFGMALLAAPAA